jgi:hypothetical protein
MRRASFPLGSLFSKSWTGTEGGKGVNHDGHRKHFEGDSGSLDQQVRLTG